MIPIPRDFREFIALLNEKRVRYVIVGGYAVAYHGHPRTTGDLDVFIELSHKNAALMLAVFREFGFATDELAPEFFMGKGQVVRLGREPLKLEILNDISGVSFGECWENRVRVRFDDLRVNFIDLTRLLANKRASGRPKDMIDVAELTRVNRQRKR
ncbi:MAG: nucleotidyltransferase [Opitutaceae bacterium]